MSVEGYALQAGSYGAEVHRRAVIGLDIRRGATIGSVTGGLVAPTDCQITIGSGLHVEVGAGEAVVAGSSSATQSGYYSRVTTTETLSIAAADPSNPRVDRVSLVVKDAAYTGAENTFTVAVETGTPTSGANLTNLSGVAAAPTSSLTLGYALVPAAASTPSEVKNVAERLIPGLSTATYREGTAAARPVAASELKGLWYYATDTHVWSFCTGAAWVEAGAGLQSSIIATEESRTNTAYGKFATPDEVTVTMPANGLILIGLQATWKSSVASAGQAGIFLGGTIIKAATGGEIALENEEPVGLQVTSPNHTRFAPLATHHGGLETDTEGVSTGSYAADVTTGQIIGVNGKGGVWFTFAAAGTYVVSLQTKSSSGSVTAKGRKLWALPLV